tara:strand:+ start:89 stop:469 length:381 start_codon:yes stop_codon:yes gene_type:complete
MTKGRRVERVAALIRREMSQLIVNGIRDERIHHGIVTITKVEVSGDLQHCKIFVSIYGEENQKDNVMSALNASIGFLRGELGRNLKLRRAPEIMFQLDRGLEKGTSVLNILERLEQERQVNKEAFD